MYSSQDEQYQELDEVKDVHPIFTANPFLIEDGLQWLGGEKHLSKDDLKRIDLKFKDKSGTDAFAEVKWSDVSESQMDEYRRLVDQHSPSSRLIWLVPTDLASKAQVASKYRIELRLYDRDKIIAIKTVQNEADSCLQRVRSLLSTTFRITMHSEVIAFEDPIAAAYFEGRALTDKGVQKKLGLKQQSVGRQLDLIRNIAKGHTAELHKEKIVLLMWEVFSAPYCYKSGKFWRIVDGGFIELIKERQDRPLEQAVAAVWNEVSQCFGKIATRVKGLYDNDVGRYDLLAMSLRTTSIEKNKAVFSIDELIRLLIDEFEINPHPPQQKVKHSVLNQWIDNIVSTTDYENDIAKRLLELATLKRMLIPKMGTVDMWVLGPSKRDGKLIAQRQPCQMLSFNRDARLYLGIQEYNV